MVILVVIVVVNGRGDSGHGDGGRGVDEQTRSLLWLLGFLIFFLFETNFIGNACSVIWLLYFK